MRLERLSTVELPQSASILSLAAHPFEPLVAVGGSEGAVRVYRFPKGRPAELVHNLSIQTKSVNVLQFSVSTGSYLAAGCADGTIKIFHMYQPHMSLAGHRLDVIDVEFIAEYQLLSCGLDGQVILWNTHQGSKIKALSGFSDAGWIKGLTGFTLPGGSVLSFSLYSDGQGLLATTHQERKIDLRADPCFQDSTTNAVYSRKPCLSPDRRLLVLPYGQRRTTNFPVLYSLAAPPLERGLIDFDLPKILLGHQSKVCLTSFAPRPLVSGGSILTVISVDGCLSLWHVHPDKWQDTSQGLVVTDTQAGHEAEDGEVNRAPALAEDLTPEGVKPAGFAKCLLVISGLCDERGVPTSLVWLDKRIYLSSSEGAITELDISDAPFEFVAQTTPSTVPVAAPTEGKRRIQPVLLSSEGPPKKKPRKLLEVGPWTVENGDSIPSGWVINWKSSSSLEITRDFGKAWTLGASSNTAFVYSEDGGGRGLVTKFSRKSTCIAIDYEWAVKSRVVRIEVVENNSVLIVFENGELIVLGEEGKRKMLSAQLPCEGDDVQTLKLQAGKLILSVNGIQGVLVYDEALGGFVKKSE